MIYFHYCESFLSITNSEVQETVTKILQSYSNQNSLKGVGKISTFTGGVYVLLIKNPYHIEIIIEERQLSILDKAYTTYFIRGVKTGLADYVSIRDGKWLKTNVLNENEVTLFITNFLSQKITSDTTKLLPPNELINWQNEFELQVKYNIFETDTWVEFSMSNNRETGMLLEQSELYKLLLLDVCDDKIKIKQSIINEKFKHNNVSINTAEFNEVGIVYLSMTFEAVTYYLLINGARLSTQKQHWDYITITEIENYKNKFDIKTYHDLCRVSLKAYPAWSLKIPDLWLKIEKNSEIGNLALLPEQTEFLKDFKFPKYINGQAGSGKSTMLYYLFANTYYYKYADLIKGDIIFITENETLLEHTKKSVRELINHNTDFNDLISEESAVSNLDSNFHSFKSFLLNLLPEKAYPFDNPDKYINFPKFKELYQSSNIPISITTKFSAEYVWFILTTYVYGYDIEEQITSLNYENKMPKDGKNLVSIEDFKKIENDIIKPYYEKWVTEQGYWDKIKLIKYINKNIEEIKQYEVIFCDEAQDFSKVELEFILRLSIYSNYNLQNVSQYPVVFAGDALQTVNPTGFKKEVLTSMIFQELTNPKIGFKLEQKRLVYEPEYNYRSSQTIVNLANVIQYERKINFDAKINNKQVSKRPIFFENQNVNVFVNYDNLYDQDSNIFEKIKAKTIIVPVNANEIPQYIEENSILKQDNLSIISAVDAKGVDFSEVVIYKFGSYYEKISTNDYEKQFFFNKLYVAVTRAQQELIIIDDEKSKNDFWLVLIKKFIDSTWNSGDNKITDQNQILIFDVNKIKQSEPKDIKKDAESLREQGIIESSIPLLTLASSNYFKLGDLKEYYLCLGKIEEIKQNWLKAALYYLQKEVKKDGIENAANAYLKGEDWKRLSDLSSQIKDEKNNIRGLISKIFLEEHIDNTEFNYLYDHRKTLKELISLTSWRVNLFGKLKNIYTSSSNKADRIITLNLIQGITTVSDLDVKKFLINEFFKIQQYDTVINIFEDIGLDYENESSDFIKIFYKANLEIAKIKSDIENIIIWLGSIAIKTNDNKTEIASEIISNYRNNIKVVENYNNTYVLLYVYFSFIILNKNNAETLELAIKVEKKFKDKNNESGLSYEYLNLYKRNKIDTNIQNFIIDRYVKNAFIGGLTIEQINTNYKEFSIEKKNIFIPFTEEEVDAITDLPSELISTAPDHFSSIEISNFRRFKNLKVDNFGLFNLVVGDNNVGKTSFLEALLFSSDADLYLERLAFAYIQRSNILPDKNISTDQNILYYKLNSNFTDEFINHSEKNLKIHFKFSYKRTAWECETNFKEGYNYSVVEKLLYEKNLEQPFMPYGKGFSSDLAKAYQTLIVNNTDATYEDKFLEKISLFIPGVKRIISDTESRTIQVRLESNMNELISLYQFGDGANKLFRILILLTLHKGERLMLDEIDSGIHHTKFKKFWKTILEIAKKDNTQIIATTHNEECIKYFYEVLLELGYEFQNESRVIQLEKVNDSVKGYSLDFKSLELSVKDNIEIRGEKI